MAEPRLRGLVERYHVAYRALPEWGADAHWKQQKVGFEIDLFGVANPDGLAMTEPSPGDPAHQATHAALREVAAWALRTGDDICASIDEYDGRVTYETATHRWHVELVAHVLHCGDVRRPVDEREQDYLRQIRHRFSSIGVVEL